MTYEKILTLKCGEEMDRAIQMNSHHGYTCWSTSDEVALSLLDDVESWSIERMGDAFWCGIGHIYSGGPSIPHTWQHSAAADCLAMAICRAYLFWRNKV